MDNFSTANNEFCLDVFKELNSNGIEENVFFSPVTMFYALSMVLFGARGNSAAQIEKVLHLNHVAEPFKSGLSECNKTAWMHSGFGGIFSQISQPNSNYTLNIANRIYGSKTKAFNQQYLSCSEQLYQARLQPVDFEQSPEEARKIINAWVESKTNGKITNLFGKGTIEPSCVMVLVNAIYFKGQWQHKFQKKETIKTPFHLGQGKSVTVDMMYQTGKFRLASIQDPQMQVLELPYVNKKLSMVILLPVGTASLGQIEKQLNVKTFHEWTSSSSLREREVEVHIPRFTLEIKYELNSLLQSLGMTDVFNQMKADLTGISPAKGLSLSKVIHKSYVDVNEEGTEATSATGDSLVVKRLPMKTQFVADHPFLFFIRHVHTNTIFFCGKLVSPSGNGIEPFSVTER
ncbi:serpin B11 [Erinaceus europaeus]|uniref:Serpin B11 n=1 Tax=Erinaceus europaeus TaxID=9365 RepID=A0ABM3W067_ERIEU|nr:serpin B11 [Erinaceus europaeus]XP_060029966.1 serpin B11 [Erinaceus europaeus]XP_060029967.1 serpin B11 [Erinaceus europaeus]